MTHLIINTADSSTSTGFDDFDIQTLRISSPLKLSDSARGSEAFYNIALTPAFHVTLDVQVVDAVQQRIETATVLGLRATINF